MANRVARILCIDGGGIRGLIPATVLRHWEAELGDRIAGRFHMLAGTSTGGILAAGLCAPKRISAADLSLFYNQDGPQIFAKSAWQSLTSLGGSVDEKYPTGPLERALAERLSGLLSQVEVADLLVTAYEIERRNPFFFKSWMARGLELDPAESAAGRDFRLVDVARATAAAPTYFEPAAVRAQNGTTYACIDGGVFANNPAMCAYAAARRLYPSADSYLIVSLGTGQLERPIPLQKAKDWGLIGWARPLLGVIFDGVSDTVDYQLDQLAPSVQHVRFQISLGSDPSERNCANDDLDDVSRDNLERLERLGHAILVSQKRDSDSVLEILRGPKTPLEDLGYPRP
jgi:patatin-like phospholipase/acyl hydrolase